MPNAPALVDDSLHSELLQVFLFMGTEWVLYLLLGLSVVSLAIAVERWVHLIRHRDDVHALRARLDNDLNRDALAEAKQWLTARRSHVARICVQGLEALPRGAAAVEQMILSATLIERMRMERGLTFLGTLGNNAPFIGLFGTVLGIIRSFRDLATNTIEGSSAVMAGIAEALVATAVGLLVALPAVALYNVFQRAIRTRLTTADALSRVILAYANTARDNSKAG